MDFGRIEKISGQLSAARTRTAELVQKVFQNSHDLLLHSVVEELCAAIEELQVAEEQLTEQCTELLSTRAELENERQRYRDLFHLAPDPYFVTTIQGTVLDANQASSTLLNIPVVYLTGKPLAVFVAPHHLRLFRRKLNGLQSIKARTKLELDFELRNNEIIPVELMVMPLYDNSGNLSRLLWTVRDESERTRHEEKILKLNTQLEETVSQRTAELEAANQALKKEIEERQHREAVQCFLADSGDQLTKCRDYQATVNKIAELSVPSLCDWCVVELMSMQRPQWKILHKDQRMMERTQQLLEQELKSRIEPANRLFNLSRCTLYQDFSSNAHADAIAGMLTELKINQAIVCPITASGNNLGTVFLGLTDSIRGFDTLDTWLVEEFARKVGLHLENKQLYAETQMMNQDLERRVLTRTKELRAMNSALEKQIIKRMRTLKKLESSREQLRNLSTHLQKAREDERARISREIHDELGQALTGIKMDLAWMLRGRYRDIDALPGKLESMIKLVDSTIQSVRRIATELRPTVLDDIGLAPAIQWQLKQFEHRSHIECAIKGNFDEVDLDTETSTAVFRIFQETLTNIARHANATQVDVRLEKKDAYFELRISDNGRGIKEDEISGQETLGLLGMTERAVAIKGDVKIEGQPGKGTTVTLRVPYHDR